MNHTKQAIGFVVCIVVVYFVGCTAGSRDSSNQYKQGYVDAYRASLAYRSDCIATEKVTRTPEERKAAIERLINL